LSVPCSTCGMLYTYFETCAAIHGFKWAWCAHALLYTRLPCAIMPIIASRSGHTAAVRKVEKAAIASGTSYTAAAAKSKSKRDSVTPFAEARRTAWEQRKSMAAGPEGLEDSQGLPTPKMSADDVVIATSARSLCNALASDDQIEDPRRPSIADKMNKRLTNMLDFATNEDEQENREQTLNKVVGVVIVLNTICMGIELDTTSDGDTGKELTDVRLFWFILETIFIFIFLVELCLRVYWERAAWVKSWWNWLDLFIVSLAMIDLWILTFVLGNVGLEMLTLIRIVRLVRLIRVVRLVRMYRTVYVMVMAMKDALGSLLCIGSMLIVGLYVCAIFTTTTIGRSKKLKELQMGPATGFERFGSMPRSMYSLFELMTLEGWENVGRPLVMEQPLMSLFLFFFIMVFTFGILNMVVAVVVEKTLQQSRAVQDTSDLQKRDEAMQELMRIRDIFQEMDEDPNGLISRKEFEDAMTHKPAVRAALESMNIPTEQASTLYDVLDADGDGELTLDELLDGCARIGGANDPVWDSIATHALVRSILGSVRSINNQMEKLNSMRSQEFKDAKEAKESNGDSCPAASGTPRIVPNLPGTPQSVTPPPPPAPPVSMSPRGSPRPTDTFHGDLLRRLEQLEAARIAAHREVLARLDRLEQRLPPEAADAGRIAPVNSKSD